MIGDVAIAVAAGSGALAWPLALALIFSAAAATPLRRHPAAVTALALAGAVAYHGASTPGFVLACGGSYAFARWLGARASAAERWRWSTLSLPLLFTLFIVGRHQSWSASPGLVWFSLDMWLVLRLVTLIWEVGSGAIAVPTPGRFTTWICLPITLGGPLLRYSEFLRATVPDGPSWRSRTWWDALAAATAKFACGIALGALHQLLLVRDDVVAGAAKVFVTGPLGFYLTYAGFFHLMQVLAIPAGFALPDSFRWPMGRRNIAEFWANWNMTATRVFRDYLFYARWGGRRHHVFLNVIILFALVGLWHGSNAYWLLWGLLHGTLFCTYLLWRRYNTRLAGVSLRGTRAASMGAAALTYLCVCACWYLPSKILQRFG